VSRLGDVIAPRRLGADYRWLLAASWATNLGDGIALAAGPLLIASQTHDPRLVALAGLLQRVPWLLAGLYAGVLADRLDRRTIMIVANLARVAVLVALTLTILTGQVSIVATLAAMFALGLAETFEDVTSQTLAPMLVRSSDLGIANARLMSGYITANQLAGPPIGAFLFAAGSATPFVVQACCVALGAVLISRLTLPQPVGDRAESRLRHEIAEGFRWLWQHRPVRTLALTIVTFNITFGAAWSVLVLYALQRLQMGEVGFGLLTTSSAVGGLVGTALYGRLERAVSLANIMRGGLVIETLTHLALAVTTTPAVALAVFFVFGAHAFIWGTTSTAVRQRAVPAEFQGRVGSVYMIGVIGGMVLGGAIGGMIANQWGVTAPFWFAFVGSALILAAIWRELAHIAHTEAAS
jgi:predicted MFS family arabinose efflux permease